MQLQQIIALFVVFLFLFRLHRQKKSELMGRNEYLFWLFFWLLAGLAIVFLKKIDSFLRSMGFSAQGIDVLVYLAVIMLFFLVLKLRIRLEKLDRAITAISRHIAINNKK